MKKLLKIFDFTQYSFSKKVILSLLAFIVIFILIKVLLSIPIVKQKNLNNEIANIKKALTLTQEKMSITSLSINMQRDLEIKLLQEKIANDVEKIELKNIKNKEELLSYLDEKKVLKPCKKKLLEDDQIREISFNRWQIFDSDQVHKSFRKKRYFQYNYKLRDLNLILSISCQTANLNPGHSPFEKKLKKFMHTNSLNDSSLSSTKTAFFWISPNLEIDDSILYVKDKNESRAKYIVSNLSNVENIPTGNLTVKEIFNATKSSEPIYHKIDGKEVLTWAIDLSNEKRRFMIIHTVDKEELENKSNSSLLFLFSETLIAIGISFVLILLLFKRVLKNINTITKTAILVNQGNKNIRSEIKGKDDIGILGQSFDSMLDFFENSIKTLDLKVKEKTKELSESLEEKETLLKEIHHRVKNNLALTIGLLELQEEEIYDDKTKKVLIDIQERIYTMELLHRKLYESTNLNKISLKAYIKDLVDAISRAYNIDEKIKIDFKIEEINLNIEATMPLGLIINELVTNSFKYAFANNDNPKLQIEISKQSNNLIIIIKDNGKGLTQDISNPNTLGLKLVDTIVKFQLQGDIEYKYENGAKFIIKGKIKEDDFLKLI